MIKLFIGGGEIFELKSGDPSKLNRKTLDEIVNFTINTFQSGMTEGEVLNHIKGNDLFLLLYKGEEAIGFAGSKYIPSGNDAERIAYLSAAVVSSEFQGLGLYKELVRERVDAALALGLHIIKTKTQNPLVEFTIREDLSRRLTKGQIIGYSVDRKMLPGAFGRKLTENFNESKDKTINIAYHSLNLDRGDGYYLTFYLELNKEKVKGFGSGI
ncbi:MAG: GNAT family N-acetyltransferase [Candidatus Acidifodinimicrobium sp.]